jgi:NAD(P)H-flavin reductase
MVGAGIGITPLRALLEGTPFDPGNATVLLRGSSESELYLGEEILDLCQRRGATLFHLVGPRPAQKPGWLPEAAARAGHRLTSYVPNLADSDVYICGPAAWARAVIDDARAAGAKEEQLHYERFDW